MSDKLTLSQLLQLYEETSQSSSSGAVGQHRRWTTEMERRGLTEVTLRAAVAAERAAEEDRLARIAAEEARLAQQRANRRAWTTQAIAICETTDEELRAKNPVQKVELLLELVPICRSLHQMDEGLAVELHAAFEQFVPRFEAACMDTTFSRVLINRIEQAKDSLGECGLLFDTDIPPPPPPPTHIHQFKEAFRAAFKGLSGQSKAISFQEVITRFNRTIPEWRQFLDDPMVMEELRAELVVDDVVVARAITPEDVALMMEFYEEFNNEKNAAVDRQILFTQLLHKYRLKKDIDYLIPYLRDLTHVFGGKRMRQKQRSRRSSKKSVNRRPKSAKTCSKRHMKWNKTTRRCNKK
jgi:hypothetical protein